MFCQKCGNQLNEGAAFCPKCGSQIGVASGVQAQGTYENGVNQTKPKKRISPLLISIGVILYGVCCIVSTAPAVRLLFSVVLLMGLVELICAIANKKAAFVLSVIQAVVFIFVFMLNLVSPLSIEVASDDIVAVLILCIVLPILPCILLLVGGIMFRKENVVNGLSGGIQ